MKRKPRKGPDAAPRGRSLARTSPLAQLRALMRDPAVLARAARERERIRSLNPGYPFPSGY